MKHLNHITKITGRPAEASLLETQAKVAIFGAFASALGVFGNALGTLIGLFDGNK